MCVYCNLADWIGKYGPWPLPDPLQPAPLPASPWTPWNPHPTLPLPPVQPWSLEQWRDLDEIMRRIKDMEDRLGGCPCEEPGKMDFLRDIKRRLDTIEEKVNEREPTEHCDDPIAAREISD